MLEYCEEVISQVQRPIKPKTIIWTLDNANDPETLQILKNESKLLFEVGSAESKSILEFSLSDHLNATDEPDSEYFMERTFLALNGKLTKRGLGFSSSFHIEIHSSHDDGTLRKSLSETVFHFGDKNSIVIVPDLYQLSYEQKRQLLTNRPLGKKLGKTYSKLPSKFKIGITVTPISCITANTQGASSTNLGAFSNLNIPIDLFSESLSFQLGKFYSDTEENYSDIKLESRDGMVFKAHRFVLAARSEKIHELLEESMKSNTFDGTIKIFDIDAKALIVLLQWIYSGKLGSVTEKILEDLVNAAVKFELTEMLKLLDGQLIKLCNPENMLRLFQVAKQNELESAKKDIAAFIKENIG